jgi:protein O-GlcNAc transferase
MAHGPETERHERPTGTTLVPNQRRALAHFLQGNNLADAGRIADAVESYRRALRLHPHYTAAYVQLGRAQLVLGQPGEAAANYQRALTLQPDLAAAHLGLGNVLRALSRDEEARDCYRRALVIDSDMTMAWNNLGATFNDLGMPARALACCQQAVQLQPDLALAHYNLANSQRDLNQLDDAVSSYRQALLLQPQFADASLNLGTTLCLLGQHGPALDCFQVILAIAPRDARAHLHLANALKDLGRFEEAVAAYRRALELRPDYAQARSNLLFCLSHGAAVDAAQWWAEHRAFGAHHDLKSPHLEPLGSRSKDLERRLAIGFVSADLRSHAVATFLEPLLQRLCHSPRLTLHAYSNHPLEDDTSQRLKHCFAHWNQVVGMSDARLAERIRSDGIDILVDLSGHTGGNRLLSFARRPAPVQVSWLGYPGTTGLAAMDYYLADEVLVPDDGARALFSEQIALLPAIAPYLPPSQAPDVYPLPAIRKGHITFGSFNRMSKLSVHAVAVWSLLLREVPSATMVLAGLPISAQDLVTAWFSQHGVDASRLQFFPRCGMAEYLAIHHEVDICLDTFPYNGGTTTSHALWMGVPTLTMAGQSPQARVGAAILNLLELKAFVAHTPEDFVERGIRAAADLEALAQLRAGLRIRLANCPAAQPAMISDALERAFRLMWQRWCKGLPPAPLDVRGAPASAH